MGKNLSSLAVASTVISVLHGNTINRIEEWSSTTNTSNIVCTTTDDTCTVNCNGVAACGVSNGVYSSGPEIHCPTTSSCTECNVYCQQRQSCSASTIYGYECNILNINVEEKDHQQLIIYAPNEGSLNISVTTGEGKLETSYIYAGNNTKDIFISCLTGKEFKENVINAYSITGILTFESRGDCKSDFSSFVCPVDTQCFIDCSGGDCKSMEIESSLGTRTLSFICGSGVGCSGTILNCDYNSNGDTDCSITNCTGPCVNPPTYAPTLNPTNIPSFSPTNIPTNEPTSEPTYIPTYEPTNAQTGLPSINPTLNPTHVPTDNPTTIPSMIPYLNPTLVPTDNPTTIPSINPSLNPTYNPIPSIPSLINPTRVPTIDPPILADNTNEFVHGHANNNSIVIILVITLVFVCIFMSMLIFYGYYKFRKQKIQSTLELQKIQSERKKKSVLINNVIYIDDDGMSSEDRGDGLKKIPNLIMYNTADIVHTSSQLNQPIHDI